LVQSNTIGINGQVEEFAYFGCGCVGKGIPLTSLRDCSHSSITGSRSASSYDFCPARFARVAAFVTCCTAVSFISSAARTADAWFDGLSPEQREVFAELLFAYESINHLRQRIHHERREAEKKRIG
jgi:hypothetical protein